MAPTEHYLFISSNQASQNNDFIITFPQPYSLYDGMWSIGLLDISCKLKSSSTRHIFLCLDECQQSYCLGAMRGCIRRLGVNSKSLEINNTFNRVQYFPLSTKSIDSLRLYLIDDQGQLVSLANQPLNCTLHLIKLTVRYSLDQSLY